MSCCDTYIIVIGNPVDGVKFFGPFDYRQDAVDWADENDFSDWWIATLQGVGNGSQTQEAST